MVVRVSVVFMGRIMNPLITFWKPLAVILLVAASFTSGCVRGYNAGSQKLVDYQSKQLAEATRIAGVRSVVTERVITRYLEKKGATERVTNTIEKEVIRYETAKLDTCPLSVAAVSLHDAAAANRIPDAAKSTDGTASSFETADLTKAATENYAICHATANRLIGLQDWVKQQSVVK